MPAVWEPLLFAVVIIRVQDLKLSFQSCDESLNLSRVIKRLALCDLFQYLERSSLTAQVYPVGALCGNHRDNLDEGLCQLRVQLCRQAAGPYPHEQVEVFQEVV